MERIFIQIASYRDPQCGPTIANLLARARHPERLSFGVCLQWRRDDPADAACGPLSLPDWPALRIDPHDASDSRGVCWARSRCQQLWNGEAFTLQIDSHMRAEPDWDLTLLASWQRAGHPRAVLSCYPNGFSIEPGTGTEQLERGRLPILAAKEFDAHGILRLQGISTFAIPDGLPSTPPAGAFVSAGMLFGPGSLIEAAPYDPELYFHGEETTLAARLWTSGYELFNPDQPALYHLYKRSGGSHTTHWADHADWSSLNQRSLQRTKALLNDGANLGRYGLGSARSLVAYQQWAGVNFQARAITPQALSGRFGGTP